MSMIGNYVMTDEQTIRKIESGDLLAEDVLLGENEESFLQQSGLCIDKAWHAIHFTLTGEIGYSDKPLGKAVMHTQFLGCEEDMFGESPLMYLTPSQVKETNTVLQSVLEEDFKAEFDVSAMLKEGVYPVTEEDNEEPEIFLEFCMQYFPSLKEFFAKAADKDRCVIFFVE